MSRALQPGGPIRVCFVSFYAYPLFNPAAGGTSGGAELQLYTMATELAKDPGFAVSFLVRDAGQPSVEVREGVAVHGYSPPRPGRRFTGHARHAWALWRRLRAIGPDIVIQRAAGALTGELALGCALSRRAFVYMVASDADLRDSPPPWWEGGARGAAYWALHRLGVRLAARVIVQHADQAALLRARHGREGIVRPSVQRFPTSPPPPRERFVLWVSRADAWKQPERFLELAEAFPQERFVMVCPPAESDPGLSRRLQQQAERFPNLDFRPFVPYREIEGLFARAQVFVNTSSIEGFPNTFVQAWKQGTPVLSLAIDPGSVIAQRGLGVVCNGDPERLRSELAALLSNRARRETCAREALAWARVHHDVSAQIEIDKTYLRAVRDRGLGRRA